MKQEHSKVKLTNRSENYSQWYLDVAKNWELFEYSPTPWCITFLPKAVSIWEILKNEIDKRLKLLWVQNLYLPLLIPMSFFEKEKEHIEWFAPELAVVTHWWWKELEERLAIRPTSETLFCDFFRWQLHSYKDLPLLYNQWVNIMRWEKRTRPFLRTTEFYWQEGHTLHETKEEAFSFAMSILNEVYIDVLNNVLWIAWIKGRKSESEKFAWADTTLTYEPMMSNGWALQICTSHMLSQDFMKQFEVGYLGREWKLEFPFYTSWGISTRSIGWMISSHSDDKWLIIPPKLSEYKAVILPIYAKDNEELVNDYVSKVAGEIVGEPMKKNIMIKWRHFMAFIWPKAKVLVDYRNIRLGEKLTDFELSWYPVAVLVGEKDASNNKCELRSRISEERLVTEIESININIDRMHEKGQLQLIATSRDKLINWGVVPCTSLEEIGIALENWKFAIYEWDQNPQFEVDIKERFRATTRCIPFEGQFTDNLMQLKNKNNVKVIVARAF